MDHMVSGVLIGFHVSYWETYVSVKSSKNFEGVVSNSIFSITNYNMD